MRFTLCSNKAPKQTKLKRANKFDKSVINFTINAKCYLFSVIL